MPGVADGALAEQARHREAGIPITTFGIDDAQVRPAAGRPEVVAVHDDLGLLADDIAPETEPGPTGQVEPQSDRFGERAGHALGQARWLEDDQERAGPTCERGQPMEAVGDTRRPPAIRCAPGPGLGAQVGRQIDEQQVHRPPLEERTGHGQALVERGRGQHHEPFGLQAARNRLDRIERPREIHPRHDRAAGLGFRRDPEGDGGLAAGVVTAQRDAGDARDPARPEDRVQRREPGGDDAPIVERRLRRGVVLLGRGREGRKRPDHEGRVSVPAAGLARLQPSPRSCASPATLQGRQGSAEVRGRDGHTTMIEQMFDSSRVSRVRRERPTPAPVTARGRPLAILRRPRRPAARPCW